MRKSLVALLVTGLLFGLAVPAAGIVNGRPDGDDHPYVGLVVFEDEDGPAWRCSGSLISPTVVLTAGHCTDESVAARVWFDEVVEGNPEYPFGGETSVEGTPHTNPDFCIGCGPGLPGFMMRDVGVVVLDEPQVRDLYAVLPEGGAVDALRNRGHAMMVGYGVSIRHRGGGTPAWGGPRKRMQADGYKTSDRFTHSDEFLRLSGDRQGGACFGDSGGPALRGTSDTVLAVASYVSNYECAGPAYYSRVDIPEVLDWIESFVP